MVLRWEILTRFPGQNFPWDGKIRRSGAERQSSSLKVGVRRMRTLIKHVLARKEATDSSLDSLVNHTSTLPCTGIPILRGRPPQADTRHKAASNHPCPPQILSPSLPPLSQSTRPIYQPVHPPARHAGRKRLICTPGPRNSLSFQGISPFLQE